MTAPILTELRGRGDRCELIARLVDVRFSRAMGAQDVDQLFRLIGVVAAEEGSDDGRATNVDGTPKYVAKIARLGRLAKALVFEFPQDHAVWDYVRWDGR